MKKEFYYGLLGLSLAFGGLLTSCVMEEETLTKSGEATVRIELNADAAFGPGTKAVNESDYTNINNYQVEVRKNDRNGDLVMSGLFSELKNEFKLERGNYFLKAYKGVEHPASRNEFYAADSTSFSILTADTQTIDLTCVPSCAKCQVVFDDNMGEYFSDYYITYSTVALGNSTVKWAKGDSEPWYLKVNKNETVKATIHLTRKSDGKTNTGEWSYALSPNQGWTLKVRANNNVSEGNLGITITIDEGTNDIPINIEVPSDWIKN